jgi:hypothetical protein|tara:strand:- start:39 stop:275 length:237 start_codon:yes stop_codon:yes gene_type:complete
MSIQIITEVNNIETDENQWWFIYNESTKIVIITPEVGYVSASSPHIMVISDSEEELVEYIEDSNLIIPTSDVDIDYPV